MVDDMAREEREAAEARWLWGEGVRGGWSWGAGRIRGGRKGRAVREGLNKVECRDGGTKGALPVNGHTDSLIYLYRSSITNLHLQ